MGNTAGRYLRLYWALAKNCLAKEMEFKANFLGTIFTDAAWYATNLLFFQTIYGHVEAIGGWSRPEVTFFLGTMYMADALVMTLIYTNLINLPDYIRTGELDHFLTKPVNSQFLVSARYLSPASLVNFLMGAAIALYGWRQLSLPFSALRFIQYLALLLNGTILIYTTFFIFQTLAFWVIRTEGLTYLYFNTYSFMMKPEGIYRGVVRVILIYLIPFIAVAGFPAKAMLRGLNPLETAWAFTASATLGLLSRRLWQAALKRYSGASS